MPGGMISAVTFSISWNSLSKLDRLNTIRYMRLSNIQRSTVRQETRKNAALWEETTPVAYLNSRRPAAFGSPGFMIRAGE